MSEMKDFRALNIAVMAKLQNLVRHLVLQTSNFKALMLLNIKKK